MAAARRTRALTATLGAICLAFAAAPALSQAAFTMSGEIDDRGHYIFGVQGDASSQTLEVRCSAGEIKVNGVRHFSSLKGHYIRCNEADVIIIEGKEGDDRINAQFISAANGFDPIGGCCNAQGGAPADAISLVGNAGKDTITGGPYGESIGYTASSGERGPDTIHAAGGNDEIYGTDDDDKIFGEAGEDVIYPQLGADVVHGGAAHDFIDDVIFAKDRDVFFGEGGRDQLFGGAGGDLIDGGGASDYMDGQGGKDRMLGRAGGDGLFGGGGRDFLFGHAGRDYIRGQAGRDLIVGGPGKDDVAQ
jgi:Ca2+-binding RTX toxin-like protein